MRPYSPRERRRSREGKTLGAPSGGRSPDSARLTNRNFYRAEARCLWGPAAASDPEGPPPGLGGLRHRARWLEPDASGCLLRIPLVRRRRSRPPQGARGEGFRRESRPRPCPASIARRPQLWGLAYVWHKQPVHTGFRPPDANTASPISERVRGVEPPTSWPQEGLQPSATKRSTIELHPPCPSLGLRSRTGRIWTSDPLARPRTTPENARVLYRLSYSPRWGLEGLTLSPLSATSCAPHMAVQEAQPHRPRGETWPNWLHRIGRHPMGRRPHNLIILYFLYIKPPNFCQLKNQPFLVGIFYRGL